MDEGQQACKWVDKMKGRGWRGEMKDGGKRRGGEGYGEQETAENRWKMRGMKGEEMMNLGEPQIPHQLWKKSVCVCVCR